VLGHNRELHVAILDVEHRVSRIALSKDGLSISVRPRSFLIADPLQKTPCSEIQSVFAHHKYPEELFVKIELLIAFIVLRLLFISVVSAVVFGSSSP